MVLARFEHELRPRRAARRAPRLTGLALLGAAAFGTGTARAELPVAPVAEIDRQELARGEIVEWCGGFAFEHPAWNASAKLALREERIGAGRSDARGVELSVGRRLGRRFSLDATSSFDLGPGGRPGGGARALLRVRVLNRSRRTRVYSNRDRVARSRAEVSLDAPGTRDLEETMRSIPFATAFCAALLSTGAASFAASHREAPLMTLDPAADITDVYAFVGYDEANLRRDPADRKAVLIMNVVPGQEPGSGPNYYTFDDNVRYQIIVDNDRDGAGLEDLVYEVSFETEVTSPGQFIRPVALAPVIELEGPGAAALASLQRYRVTELRDCELDDGGLDDCERTKLFDGRLLPTVPSNIGPRTTPNYAALAAKGVFEDPDTGIRVFAGQRAETFAIDLGAVFDTLNLRVETPPGAPGRPPLPVQTAAEDADDASNPFGVNNFSGFNVQTIAIEVPIRRLTRNGRPANAGNGAIGVWARTLRQRETVRRGEPQLSRSKPLLEGRGGWVQVSRMANPLVNELIIRFGRKDFWNATLPEDETQFVGAYRDLDVAGALELVSNVLVPDPPRDDIVQLLLQYQGEPRGVLSELLRLDLTVPPTPPDQIRRLGPFAHDALGNPTPDPAGFPNGRRPDDDVTDIVVRAAGGPNFIAGFVGDGVGINEQGIAAEFPFLPTPFDGRNRRHVDPGE